MGAFFICSENKKREISNLVFNEGYTFKVLSYLDYNL